MLQKKRDWNVPISESSQLYVPLKQLRVDATIQSFAANVTITQIFRNDETVPIEAVYCFPIEEQAAVYAFVARIDDLEIVAQLKEKKEAQRDYNDALREHHGAYMLEQDEESQDNFIINVGALSPNKECHITVSYVSELDLVQNGTKIRFVVPTTIAPRYNPNQGSIGSPAGTTTQYVQSAPYTIEFHCCVEKCGISRVSSMSHPIQIDFNQEDVYLIEFAQTNTHLDRDIIMDFELAENRSSTIVAVESGAIMASFTPTEQDCRCVINDGNITNEFIFIVDCSGSMRDENKIGLARQAMLLFLKSLPIDCHFNIIRFGNNYKSLFSDMTTIYNEDNVRQAEQLINDMKADFGGTELLPPLNWLKENPPIQGHSRQIFLLSDGEISNVDAVLNLCRSMAASTRIFSFGLGHAPSHSLIKSLARATNGRFVFIPPDTYVDVYVGEQLQKALQPCITNVRIKLNLDPTLINIVPTSSPPVFINDRLIVYAVLNNDKLTSFDHDVSVELYSEQHRLCEAKVNRVPSVSNDGTIARLAAKALILELQHSKLPSSTKQYQEHDRQQTQASKEESQMTMQQIREKIIEISLKHNILSPYTAFVGIEKRINASNADMVLREVPIEISADNQYLKYLERTISQMRCDQDKQAQLCYEASSIKHDYDQLSHQVSYISHAAHEGHRRSQQYFADICNNYDRAQMRLTSALTEYDKARQHFDSTRMDKDEAKNYVDHIRNDYDEARKHLDDTRMKYNKARQYLDNTRREYYETRRDINHAFNFDRTNMHYDRVRHNIDCALNRYDNVQQHFDNAISCYDKAQQRYEDVIQSIDESYDHFTLCPKERSPKVSGMFGWFYRGVSMIPIFGDLVFGDKVHNQSYQLQKASSAKEGQQLSQRCRDEINSVDILFQDAHKTLKRCENEKRYIENDLEKARDSLEYCMNEMRTSTMESMYCENQVYSSEIRYAEELLHQESKKQSSKKSLEVVRNDNQEDLDTVRRIIAEQKFDGLWNVDVKIIEQLTGKSLSEFQQLTNAEMLISAIIIVVLETRFASLVSMWYGVVQKARKRLLDMLDKDSNKFTTLIEDIQKQL